MSYTPVPTSCDIAPIATNEGPAQCIYGLYQVRSERDLDTVFWQSSKKLCGDISGVFKFPIEETLLSF